MLLRKLLRHYGSKTLRNAGQVIPDKYKVENRLGFNRQIFNGHYEEQSDEVFHLPLLGEVPEGGMGIY